MAYTITRSASGCYHLKQDERFINVSFTYIGARFSLWWRKHTRMWEPQQPRLVYREEGE